MIDPLAPTDPSQPMPKPPHDLDIDVEAADRFDEAVQALRPPPLRYLASEPRALLEYGWYLQSLVWLRTLPKGDGHPVLVLPGFTTGDTATRPLRRFLRGRRYKAYGWLQGLNLGLNDHLEVRMIRRLRDLYYRHGRRVSIIGWSLGGIYARELARLHPGFVRQVITLGSPFNMHPRANHAWRLYERLSNEKIEAQTKRLEGLEKPLEVPSSAVFTRTDGIVAWQCCLQETGPEAENIEIYGSHCGLGHNPMALYVIADRLAQEADQWSAFDRSGMRKLFFRRVQSDAVVRPPASQFVPHATVASA